MKGQLENRTGWASGLAAGLIVCLLLMQAHAALHSPVGLRPLGQRAPVPGSHGSGTPDCQMCAGSHWVAPAFAPHIESPQLGDWVEARPRQIHFEQDESRQTAPRAPPRG